MHPKTISIKDYSYQLPAHRIAAYPAVPRDASKLLVYANCQITEDTYAHIAAHIPAGALMVFNQTKVIHARLQFTKSTGSCIEVFCLAPHSRYKDMATAMSQKGEVVWQCMVGGAKKWKQGTVLTAAYPDWHFTLTAHMESREGSTYIIRLSWEHNPALTFAEVLHHAGKIPLPPYIQRDAAQGDAATYQTIYARDEGSVAAPTAGLHFTEQVMDSLAAKGIQTDFVTLHVGAGTFMPVKSEVMEGHTMHTEWIEVTIEMLQALYNSLQHTSSPAPSPSPFMERGPGGEETTAIIAVGTTAMRTLESLYHMGNTLVQGGSINWQDIAVTQWQPYETNTFCTASAAIQALIAYMQQHNRKRLVTRTGILIAPGYTFRVVSALVTNFHQPDSTLLLLVAALAGNYWKKIYDYALTHDFRFLSYGDGSLLWNSLEK